LCATTTFSILTVIAT